MVVNHALFLVRIDVSSKQEHTLSCMYFRFLFLGIFWKFLWGNFLEIFILQIYVNAHLSNAMRWVFAYHAFISWQLIAWSDKRHMLVCIKIWEFSKKAFNLKNCIWVFICIAKFDFKIFYTF